MITRYSVFCKFTLAQPASLASCLIFGLIVRLLAYVMCATCACSDEAERMRRLV